MQVWGGEKGVQVAGRLWDLVRIDVGEGGRWVGFSAFSLTSRRNRPAVVKKLKRFSWAGDIKLTRTVGGVRVSQGLREMGENGLKRLLRARVRGTCKGC